MSQRCATEYAERAAELAIQGIGGRRARSRSPLFTTWHVLRRHIDLCRTSAAMCRPTH
jgi:hypothetical protein